MFFLLIFVVIDRQRVFPGPPVKLTMSIRYIELTSDVAGQVDGAFCPCQF